MSPFDENTSEKYENEYCNCVEANELSNKYSIKRQRQMIADIRKLQAELEAESKLVEIRTASCNESNARNKQLQAENEKLKKVVHEQGKCLASVKYNMSKP